MPGFLLGFISGGNNLLSGNFFSGLGAFHPQGGLQLIAYPQNSGSVYVTLSGNLTITSGGINLSGFANTSGLMDGLPLAPGTAYYIPKLGVGISGSPTLYVNPDASCSGQARIHVEPY